MSASLPILATRRGGYSKKPLSGLMLPAPAPLGLAVLFLSADEARRVSKAISQVLRYERRGQSLTVPELVLAVRHNRQAADILQVLQTDAASHRPRFQRSERIDPESGWIDYQWRAP